MEKPEIYYIKDSIKCSKRDLKDAAKSLKWAIGDLIVGYYHLIKAKVGRK